VIQKANSASTVWAGTPLYRRAEILYRFCDMMLQNVEDIAVTLTSEMGKPIAQSRDEISGAVVVARGYVERAKHLYGDLLPTENQPGFQNDLIFTRREPLGVIVCVIPFNYPVDSSSKRSRRL
jgi:succinate-semialdehyde dehydrogenase/glutarate-semialdehyde dehydrogenase